MLTLLTLPFLPILAHLSRHTGRLTVMSWADDMTKVKPARNWLGWLIDHDFLVGGILCALPVGIGIGILFILGI